MAALGTTPQTPSDDSQSACERARITQPTEAPLHSSTDEQQRQQERFAVEKYLGGQVLAAQGKGENSTIAREVAREVAREGQSAAPALVPEASLFVPGVPAAQPLPPHSPRMRQNPVARALAMLLCLAGLPGLAHALDEKTCTSTVGEAQREHHFLLRVVQPGLAGLMDGSVSTLAPIFATAFVTHLPYEAFLVGMAAATGAGISMAFAEALSDTGELTGRGAPWLRGGVTGIMTFLGGSLHTLPFLIPNLQVALLAAYVVVAVELVVIASIRHRFFGTSWALSMLQVVGGGALVFLAALFFGNA